MITNLAVRMQTVEKELEQDADRQEQLIGKDRESFLEPTEIADYARWFANGYARKGITEAAEEMLRIARIYSAVEHLFEEK